MAVVGDGTLYKASARRATNPGVLLRRRCLFNTNGGMADKMLLKVI